MRRYAGLFFRFFLFFLLFYFTLRTFQKAPVIYYWTFRIVQQPNLSPYFFLNTVRFRSDTQQINFKTFNSLYFVSRLLH